MFLEISELLGIFLCLLAPKYVVLWFAFSFRSVDASGRGIGTDGIRRNELREYLIITAAFSRATDR